MTPNALRTPTSLGNDLVELVEAFEAREKSQSNSPTTGVCRWLKLFECRDPISPSSRTNVCGTAS